MNNDTDKSAEALPDGPTLDEALRECVEALALWANDYDSDPGDRILSAMANGVTALADFDKGLAAQAQPAPAVQAVQAVPSDAEIGEVLARVLREAKDEQEAIGMVRDALLSRYGSQAGGQDAPESRGYDEGADPPNKALYILMSQWHLQMLTGQDLRNVLDFGRAAWQAGKRAALAAPPAQPEADHEH